MMVEYEVASASDEVRKIFGVIYDPQAQEECDDVLQKLWDVAFEQGVASGYGSGYSAGYEQGVSDGYNAAQS
jgi:flagellar biosynthesis/type III secretory pathway protein FliH